MRFNVALAVVGGGRSSSHDRSSITTRSKDVRERRRRRRVRMEVVRTRARRPFARPFVESVASRAKERSSTEFVVVIGRSIDGCGRA